MQTPPAIDVNTVADLFLQRNMVREDGWWVGAHLNHAKLVQAHLAGQAAERKARHADLPPHACHAPPFPQVREATAFLLDALAGDRPEHAALQTKLLEINLITNPQVRLLQPTLMSWLFSLLAACS